MPGTIIKVKWPVGWTDPVPAAGSGTFQIQSADPNDHYRPWLTENVGWQGWDWDWAWCNNSDYDNVDIKFRIGKRKYAVLAILKWS